MKKVLLATTILGFALVSCSKKNCANAIVCMVNNTQDTVYYSWNSNLYTDTLPPGEKTCSDVGELTPNSSYTTYFESSSGNYALDVSKCEETYYLD